MATRTAIGSVVNTKDGKGYVVGRTKSRGVLYLSVKFPNGGVYRYRADDVERA